MFGVFHGNSTLSFINPFKQPKHYPKNPDPSRKFVGLMASIPSPEMDYRSNPEILGHIWILSSLRVPIASMHGVCTYIWLILRVNVGK